VEFNSYSYLLALIPVVALFWALPPVARRWYVLVLSLGFYASWGATYAFLPIAICGAVFWCAHRMLAAGETPAGRRWFLGGIAFVLIVLSYFKYANFFLDNFARLIRMFGAEPGWGAVQVALPLGISFYSFEAISFLIDSRQGRVKKPAFLDMSLFVLFWPHLVAGPIVRVRELVPQFSFSKKFDASMLALGLDRLLWGLVQKNVFANPLGSWVDDGFRPAATASLSTIDGWALAVAFGLQIYFDFASYSNMAIGTARLMGVTLPENFRHPYHAVSPPDFWGRWHMTLSRWIRDYLFFPVNARYQAAPGPLYASLLGIMGLAGLWHGAGWGFIAWGLLQGLYLVLYRIWESATESRPGWKEALPVRLGWRLATLAMVMTAWIPFRASTGEQAAVMLKMMYTGFRFHLSQPVNFYLIVAGFVVFCALEPWLGEKIEQAGRSLEARTGNPHNLVLARPLLYAVCLLLFLAFDARDAKFIYFQF